MARTVGKLLCTIWNDDDWRALTKDAQRLYMLLLSQGRLGLAGALDLMPARWSTLAADETLEELHAALDELERRRFVAIDRATGEVVIRTFTKHDIASGTTVNRNIAKGFWSAWSGVMSPILRQIVVDNAPDALFTAKGADVPAAALQMRRSPRFEPPSEPSSQPGSEPPSEQPNGRGIEPPTPTPRTTPSPSSTPVRTDPDDDDLTRARRTEAHRRAQLKVDRQAGTTDEVISPAALERTILANLTAEGWTPPATNGHHRPDPLARPAIADAAQVVAEAMPDPDELAATDQRAGLALARQAFTHRSQEPDTE